MAVSLVSNIETLARARLNELTPRYWTSQELVDIVAAGIRDLWRDVVNLKQEHYLVVDTTNVTFAPLTDQLTGVPTNVHKIYLIETLDSSPGSSSQGTIFMPKDFNHRDFQMARTMPASDPANRVFYYAPAGAGGPVGTTTIYVSPRTSSTVAIRFCYIPTLGEFLSSTPVPIPAESDNALVAWTVAYARAKEREDRAPDPGWITIYSTEKQHLLESLGVRQYQEPQLVDAMFDEYWD